MGHLQYKYVAHLCQIFFIILINPSNGNKLFFLIPYPITSSDSMPESSFCNSFTVIKVLILGLQHPAFEIGLLY